MKNFILRFLSSIILAPIFLYIIYSGGYLFLILLFLIIIISLYEIFKNIKKKNLCFLLVILIFLFIHSFYILRNESFENFIICTWFFLIVWLSDIGGYIFGKIFGGKKLSRFSPNKTISGLCGSLVMSQFAFLIQLIYLTNKNYSLKIFILQFFLSITSVIGDIFFSYIKRSNNIKDYSNIIPGHGGLLDRIDGFIFVIIFANLFNYINVI